VFQDSIAGLSVGAPVTFRGVRVGAVETIAIQYDPRTNTAYIPVKVVIDPGRALIMGKSGTIDVDLIELINRGLRAELAVQSFVTGQSEIDLDFDPSSAPVLHGRITDLPEIPTRQSSLQKVTEQLGKLPLHELADNATATLVSLRTLAEKLDQDMPPLVASLTVTANKSTQAVETATEAIRHLQDRLDETLAAITAVANTGGQQLTQRGAELHTLLAASNQSVQQVHDLLANLKELTSNRGQAYGNLESALRDLAAATASLRGFAGDVERNPQLLLTGRKP
jgi:paraquat-inducible protein B